MGSLRGTDDRFQDQPPGYGCLVLSSCAIDLVARPNNVPSNVLPYLGCLPRQKRGNLINPQHPPIVRVDFRHDV
jgi:hypothetical protein